MKEKVFVTALSICMILTICPGMLLYANEFDQQGNDLFGKLDGVLGELVETSSDKSISETEEITGENNSDEEKTDFIATDLPVYTAESTKNNKVLIVEDIICPDFENKSEISQRAPPKAL